MARRCSVNWHGFHAALMGQHGLFRLWLPGIPLARHGAKARDEMDGSRVYSATPLLIWEQSMLRTPLLLKTSP